MKKHVKGVPVGDLVGKALRDLGVSSSGVARRVQAAWRRAADPSWVGRVRLEGLVGGVLTVAVDSSSLRQELVQFHRDRLLGVLRTALPDVPLVGIRFAVGNAPAQDGGGKHRGEPA